MGLIRTAVEPSGIFRGSASIAEVMRGTTPVWSSGYALPKSAPDYWYSLGDGSHSHNRGSKPYPLYFPEVKSFANRGESAWTNNAQTAAKVVDPWDTGFTMAGWFHKTGNESLASGLFSRGDYLCNFLASIPTASGGRIRLQIQPQGNNGGSFLTTTVLPHNVQNHLAITVQYTSSQVMQAEIFLNGVLAMTQQWNSSVSNLVFSQNHALSFGSGLPDRTTYFDGNVRDMAAWSRVLSPAEIAAIHRDGPIPAAKLPAAPPVGALQSLGPAVWLPFTNNPRENLGYNYDGASFGTPATIVNVGGQNVGRFTMNGSTRVFIPRGQAEWLNGGTIGGWFRDPGGSSTGERTIFQRAFGPSTTNQWEIYLNMNPANGRLRAGAQVNGVWWDMLFGASVNNIADGNWHYLAATLTRTNSNWVLTAYADANTITSNRNSSSQGAFDGNDNFFYVGGGRDATLSNMQTDDAVMFNRPLSAAEIATIRNAGRSTPNLIH